MHDGKAGFGVYVAQSEIMIDHRINVFTIELLAILWVLFGSRGCMLGTCEMKQQTLDIDVDISLGGLK